MGKSAPKPPAPPDPQETAAAQAAANKETAIAQQQLNAINQVTPYGKLSFSQNGWWDDAREVPRLTATTTLTPEQMEILGLTQQAGINYGQLANQQLGAVSDRLGQPLDFASLGAAPQANEATRDEVAGALTQRFQPYWDRDLDQLETRLANQGIQLGSEAYSRAMQDYGRAVNDARLGIENAALGQMLQLYGAEENQRGRRASEMIQERTQPLNELAAMLTGSQVQSPGFVPTPQSSVQPTDIAGLTYADYNARLNNYNQQLAQQNSAMGGLFGLGGSLIGALPFGNWFGGA